MNSGASTATTIEDLRKMARQRLPRILFDFIDGGAEDEVTLRDNREQFDHWRLIARHPINVSRRETDVELFGERFAAPFVISPTGLASLARGRAEVALARAAHRMGIPITLSTASSVDLDDLAASAGGAARWFQLYILKDRVLSETMIARARSAGYTTLVISVDCPVVGQRERDIRNRFAVPLKPSLATMIDVLLHPRWLLDFVRHGAPKPRNLAAPGENSAQQLTSKMIELLDPSISWSDIAWVRAKWRGPLILKGLVSTGDARLAVKYGVDGIVVSNQGGRQLDGAVPTLEALPAIVDAVGDRCTVFCDGGFRRGSDVAKALALGARAVFLGRATLFGAAAGGEDGAFRALEILRSELSRVMAFTGCTSIGELTTAILWDAHRRAPYGMREIGAK